MTFAVLNDAEITKPRTLPNKETTNSTSAWVKKNCGMSKMAWDTATNPMACTNETKATTAILAWT